MDSTCAKGPARGACRGTGGLVKNPDEISADEALIAEAEAIANGSAAVLA